MFYLNVTFPVIIQYNKSLVGLHNLLSTSHQLMFLNGKQKIVIASTTVYSKAKSLNRQKSDNDDNFNNNDHEDKYFRHCCKGFTYCKSLNPHSNLEM